MSGLGGFLLSFGSPAELKSAGIWAIIAGLVAEVVAIAAIPSGSNEKLASVICTLVIALGVWVEHVGSAALEAPRQKLIEPPAIRARVLATLEKFPGTKFDIGHPDGNAREAWNFLWALEPLLSKGGWVQVDWIGGEMFQKDGWPLNPKTGQKYWYGEANVNNVSLEVRPAYKAALMPAADALAETLNKIGIVTVTYDNNNPSQNDDAIHVLVGPKE